MAVHRRHGTGMDEQSPKKAILLYTFLFLCFLITGMLQIKESVVCVQDKNKPQDKCILWVYSSTVSTEANNFFLNWRNWS